MRRVVTGHDSQGRSVVVDDGVPPRTHEFAAFPGFVSSLAWATDPDTHISWPGEDVTMKVESMLPPPGGTRLRLVTVPPDAAKDSLEFDAAAFGAEQRHYGPGLAELFEPNGMHTTPTIDYTIVLDGELWLELDGGHLTHLKAGDLVVQNGTRHAWRNRSDRPVYLAAILIGATAEAAPDPPSH
ncbi:cupin domain-containing protein [Streptomyces chartreusis]|uniref:Cupin domain-containing protein n=1 Tax=Streptomyces chartreusis TaxID=1969 RepID=A0A7H8T1D4_STRCX|nr:cupin domain-containing protein [Streptomyces chartreusis]QKZ17319.1 cupin domain-containing protein [Streptomyces chartreusis]